MLTVTEQLEIRMSPDRGDVYVRKYFREVKVGGVYYLRHSDSDINLGGALLANRLVPPIIDARKNYSYFDKIPWC